MPTVGKLLMLLVLSLCFSIKSYCQTVTGKVTDKDGKALSGVSVKVKGSSGGTTTNASGQYSIAASPAAALQFSSVGYALRGTSCFRPKGC